MAVSFNKGLMILFIFVVSAVSFACGSDCPSGQVTENGVCIPADKPEPPSKNDGDMNYYDEDNDEVEIADGDEEINSELEEEIPTQKGLIWQNPPSLEKMEWADAIDYCENLTLHGLNDWRLPTISELRELITGCEATEADGPCNVSENSGCTEISCHNEYCSGCVGEEGPDHGCYWPNEMDGVCGLYWSSTDAPEKWKEAPSAWRVDFIYGYVLYSYVDSELGVRCVREGRVSDGEYYSTAYKNLAWQTTATEETMTFDDAVKYCDDLTLDDHDDWHLPTISELRSLIDGCAYSYIDGTCRVRDEDCLEANCFDLAECEGCGDHPGPNDGCYWKEEIADDCAGDNYSYVFWSSSHVGEMTEEVWTLKYDAAFIEHKKITDEYNVRCARWTDSDDPESDGDAETAEGTECESEI